MINGSRFMDAPLIITKQYPSNRDCPRQKKRIVASLPEQQARKEQ
jgi:hypothetical protein